MSRDRPTATTAPATATPATTTPSTTATPTSAAPPAGGGPAPLDLTDLNDPRVLATGWVRAGSTVVDLGTGDAAVPATLRRTGCQVRAVEIDPVAAAAAREVCDQVVVADLDTLDLESAFGPGRADTVLALDVLGWVSDPVSLLRRAVEHLLDPGGWIVMTLPNVGHASVRLRLLAGRFSPAQRALDGAGGRKRLHHFDAAGRDALLADAGLVALACRSVPAPLDPEAAELFEDDPGLLRRLEVDPDALAAVYVVTAVPAGSPLVADPPLLPAVAAQEVAAEAVARAERLTARLAEVEPVAGAVDELLPFLEAIRAASASRRETLRSLLRMLEGNLEAMSDNRG